MSIYDLEVIVRGGRLPEPGEAEEWADLVSWLRDREVDPVELKMMLTEFSKATAGPAHRFVHDVVTQYQEAASFTTSRDESVQVLVELFSSALPRRRRRVA